MGTLHVHPWPTDTSIAQLVVTDHPDEPDPADILAQIDATRQTHTQAIRTGALFPDTARVFASLGFRPIDTLCLLRLDLTTGRYRRDRREQYRRAKAAGARLRPLTRRHLDDAARVDQAAFGMEWGNSAGSLRRIRTATPQHHDQCVRHDDRLAAFAITGVGGGRGYLQRLAVDIPFQRAGYGRLLVVDSLAWMQSQGATTALVNTGATNEPALTLYRSFDFALQPETLTVMELRLDD